MNLSKVLCVARTVLVFVSLNTVACAAIVTYDFSVTAISGPLVGTSANGFFSFDEITAPAFANTNATGLITDLAFTWNGINYTEANANTGFINRDFLGKVTAMGFGTNCLAGGCTSSIFIPADNWFVDIEGASGRFAYAGLGDQDNSGGSASATLRVGNLLPVPATLAMLGIGLAVLGATRRKKS